WRVWTVAWGPGVPKAFRTWWSGSRRAAGLRLLESLLHQAGREKGKVSTPPDLSLPVDHHGGRQPGHPVVAPGEFLSVQGDVGEVERVLLDVYVHRMGVLRIVGVGDADEDDALGCPRGHEIAQVGHLCATVLAPSREEHENHNFPIESGEPVGAHVAQEPFVDPQGRG